MCVILGLSIHQIHANAKSYDRLVNDQHYLMKTELTDDNTCVVQFTTEQGKVMTTYTFFKAVISEEAKKNPSFFGKGCKTRRRSVQRYAAGPPLLSCTFVIFALE